MVGPTLLYATDEGGGLTGPFSRLMVTALTSRAGLSPSKVYLDPAALAAGEGFDFSVAATTMPAVTARLHLPRHQRHQHR